MAAQSQRSLKFWVCLNNYAPLKIRAVRQGFPATMCEIWQMWRNGNAHGRQREGNLGTGEKTYKQQRRLNTKIGVGERGVLEKGKARRKPLSQLLLLSSSSCSMHLFKADSGWTSTWVQCPLWPPPSQWEPLALQLQHRQQCHSLQNFKFVQTLTVCKNIAAKHICKVCNSDPIWCFGVRRCEEIEASHLQKEGWAGGQWLSAAGQTMAWCRPVWGRWT